MRYTIIEHASLAAASRWTPSFFFRTDDAVASGYAMVELRQVMTERKGAIDPQTLGDQQISYLGLENIRPKTGELIDFSPRAANTIKSRSKIFRASDVLFGRLRPELNKVYLVDGEPAYGVCSGEFIVLVPIASRVNSRYMRHVIASPFVSQYVEKFRVGASLPRISADDLLSIKVPIPPLGIQEKIAQQLEATDIEIRAVRRRLEELPEQQLAALLGAIELGSITSQQ